MRFLICMFLALGIAQTARAGSPFDPDSCTGEPITMKEVLSYFYPGESESRVFGSYLLKAHSRRCNSFTGCGEWGDEPTDYIYFTNDYNIVMEGKLQFQIQGEKIVLALYVGDTDTDSCPSKYYAALCEGVGTDKLTCSAYKTGYIHYGGPGNWTCSSSTLISKGEYEPAHLTGKLTNHCLRLSAPTRGDVGVETEAGLYVNF